MDFDQMISSQTDVALSLTKQIVQTKAEGSNMVFSPFSIQVMLSAIADGSNGSTLDQLLHFLKSKSNDLLSFYSSEVISAVYADGSSVGGPRLLFANSVWIDRSLPLKPSFKQILDNVYKAASNQVDFQTQAVRVAGEVNLWANEVTNGLIEQVLPPESVDASTRLIFADALYFKGAWSEKFNASETKDYDFHLINGCSVKVPFMTGKKDRAVRAFDGFKVLRLPYQQGAHKRRFSMYFFLPDTKDGLPALVEKMGSESGYLERHLPYRPVKVGEFRIPRFKISFGFEASEVLKRLGLVLPFSGEGGLTEMVDSPGGQNLYVSNVLQKSFIEVNEEGTEAAPVTKPLWRHMRATFPIDFVADHPFLFLIREDETGVVLLIGQVVNPLE